MKKTWPTLYSRDNLDRVRVWYIKQDGAAYSVCSGLKDGQHTTTDPTVCKGKNLGKANETSPVEQATKQVEALYKKQIDSNYFEDINEIDNGWLEPQLAFPFKKYPDYLDLSGKSKVIVDHKLNGVCCLATKKGLYSRTNKRFYSIPHIEKAMAPIFEKYPNAYLHGELFNEKYIRELNELIELVSVGRKPKDITPELLKRSEEIVQLHLYDGYGFSDVEQSTPMCERKVGLDGIPILFPSPYLKITPWHVVSTTAQMNAIYDKYAAIGGEGVILRKYDAPYEHKRSKNLLKVKKQETEEFEVVELLEGDGNWKGKAKMAVCKLPNGETFKTNLDGSQKRQEKAWKERKSYVGKQITVRFQEYSPYGVPLIPYSDLTVRDYE